MKLPDYDESEKLVKASFDSILLPEELEQGMKTGRLPAGLPRTAVVEVPRYHSPGKKRGRPSKFEKELL